MDRRNFLSLLIAAGAGFVLDPERLLWTPKVMITVPAMPYTPHYFYVDPVGLREAGLALQQAIDHRIFATIYAALKEATNNTTIIVAPGHQEPVRVGEALLTIPCVDNLTIVGSGATDKQRVYFSGV